MLLKFDLHLLMIMFIMTSRCVVCNKQLMSELVYVCNSTKCGIDLETIPIGDYVIKMCSKEPEVVKFLLSTSRMAVSDKMRFAPFPNAFTKTPIYERKFESQDVSFDKIFEFLGRHDNKDDYFIKEYTKIYMRGGSDSDAYNLDIDTFLWTKFVLMSNKTKLRGEVYDVCTKTFNGRLNKYEIVHDIFVEDEFKGGYNVFGYLFHGSKKENWHSILRNGIKVCSGTKFMSTGAAYGNGIYLSDNINISQSYSDNIIAIFEVRGDIDRFRKSMGIYVINNDVDLILRYIIEIPSKKNLHEQKLGEELLNIALNYKRVRSDSDTRIKKSISNRLPKDIVDIDAYECTKVVMCENGYLEVLIDTDGIVQKLIRVDLLNYPQQSPHIYVLKPKLYHPRVTDCGNICMDMITPHLWSPMYRLSSIIVNIDMLLKDAIKVGKEYNVGGIRKIREDYMMMCGENYG